jgi:hypothetical protein
MNWHLAFKYRSHHPCNGLSIYTRLDSQQTFLSSGTDNLELRIEFQSIREVPDLIFCAVK